MADPAASSMTAVRGTSRHRPRRSRSLWLDAWARLVRNPMFVVPMIVVLIVVSMAIVPSLWTSVDPTACALENSKKGPSAGHPFGFTVYGCDMYAQVIYGTRPDLTIALICAVGTTVLGIVLGTAAAFFGGWVDTIVSRITDIFFGLPFVLAALLILSIMGSHSVWSVSVVMIVFGWPAMTRIMRGSVLGTKGEKFVDASRALGANNLRLIFRHILPNAIAPAIVMSTIGLGSFVSAEATLTFLGIGLRQPTISWGVLIATGQDWAVTGVWHLLVFPCLFLIATVLSFILLGDALRDALDVRLR